MKTSNSHEYEFELFQNMIPSLRYTGDSSFEEWKKKARNKLEELLGLPLKYCKPEIAAEYIKENEDHTEYRFTVETEPGYTVPCHLLIPNAIKENIPLTICQSGHGGGMHLCLGAAKTEADKKSLAAWPHRAMAKRAIRDGRAALVIEARNFGESSLNGYGTSCTEASKIAILAGRTVIGERVWDSMRILDAVLASFPVIDRNTIVCTGNSGGGTVTFYLSCIDERIAYAAPSCAVCSFGKSIAAMEHCMCNFIPQIRKYFEMGDLGGLVAPRTLVIAAGEQDTDFPIDGTYEAFRLIQNAYDAAGVPEQCALVTNPGGHYNYADEIWNKLHQMGLK